MAALLLAGPAMADDDHNCQGGHNCNGGGGDIDIDIGGSPVDVTGGATNVETNVAGSQYDSRALALGNTLGDVDINDCLGSEQFGTPLFSRQWLELNKWCAAEVYDAKGMQAMAARLRCEIKEIRSLYPNKGGHEACLAENTSPAGAFEATVLPAEIARKQEIHEEKEEEHEYQLAQVMQRQAELEQRLKTEAANRRKANANYARERKAQAQADASETEAFLQQYKEIAQLPEPTGNE